MLRQPRLPERAGTDRQLNKIFSLELLFAAKATSCKEDIWAANIPFFCYVVHSNSLDTQENPDRAQLSVQRKSVEQNLNLVGKFGYNKPIFMSMID